MAHQYFNKKGMSITFFLLAFAKALNNLGHID